MTREYSDYSPYELCDAEFEPRLTIVRTGLYDHEICDECAWMISSARGGAVARPIGQRGKSTKMFCASTRSP